MPSTTQDIRIKTIQGVDVPALGFGTYELKGDTCRHAVETALDIGYRHIDTARAYENEAEVGAAIAGSSLDRNDLFITSKVWMGDVSPSDLKRAAHASVQSLQCDYLDLYLIHWPNPDIPLEASLKAMQELQDDGLLRHFGVSNFTPGWLKRALDCANIFCNQVEYHPLLSQDKLLRMCRENDVLLTAYSPLGQGEAIGRDTLEAIAEKHGKSSTQVAIRWLVEQDHVAAIPRSSKPDHIADNFNVFDFELDDEDREQIATLPKDKRQIDPSFAPDWND